jgi:hypothetical protein
MEAHMNGGTKRWMRGFGQTAALVVGLTVLGATEARAHCDTMDGPVVAAARKALETGSVNPALIWVREADEKELRLVFEHTSRIRSVSAETRHVADRLFFETTVRLHRKGEGEPFTGLKPAGSDVGPVIPEADRALASGSLARLEEMLLHEIRDGLRHLQRIRRALQHLTGQCRGGGTPIGDCPLLEALGGMART